MGKGALNHTWRLQGKSAGVHGGCQFQELLFHNIEPSPFLSYFQKVGPIIALPFNGRSLYTKSAHENTASCVQDSFKFVQYGPAEWLN